MAGVPLKFRCYQCNQLLGVSRGKVGTVVACPKCRADLIVPDPDEAEFASELESTDIASSPRAGEASEEGISLDLLDIRPEDIRVEPGVNWTPPLTESAPREPFPYLPPEPEPPAFAASGDVPPPINVVGPAGATTSGATSRASEPLVPPIQFESTRIAETRIAPSRSRDVVLPRSVVATWSLFVLLAQGLSFVAGLLAGHFLWRVH